MLGVERPSVLCRWNLLWQHQWTPERHGVVGSHNMPGFNPRHHACIPIARGARTEFCARPRAPHGV
jgi:hypothetical protein